MGTGIILFFACLGALICFALKIVSDIICSMDEIEDLPLEICGYIFVATLIVALIVNFMTTTNLMETILTIVIVVILLAVLGGLLGAIAYVLAIIGAIIITIIYIIALGVQWISTKGLDFFIWVIDNAVDHFSLRVKGEA